MRNFIPNNEQKLLNDKLIYWDKTRYKPYFAFSGPAGSGKTTVIRYFLENMGISLHEVICCAYVGKAVAILAYNGLPAMTIHSLIYDNILVPLEKNGDYVYNSLGNIKMINKFILKKKLDYPYKYIIVDEASMVNDEILEDLLSFNIPLIFIGDMNQLPPIFGKSTVMLNPDFVLTKIMRQAENDPIIMLSQMALHNYPFRVGNYGKSNIISSLYMGNNLITDYDVIIVPKNKMRDDINMYIRQKLLRINSMKPQIGEKLICRQNNWNIGLGKGLYLTNGTTGIISDIDKKSSSKNKTKIEFIPDLTDIPVDDIWMDYNYIQIPYADERQLYGISSYNKFEYGYAITAHLSQGSQYPRVLFMDGFFKDAETTAKLRYTAITRAMSSIDIVIPSRRF